MYEIAQPASSGNRPFPTIILELSSPSFFFSGAVALITHGCRDTQLLQELGLSPGPPRSGAEDGEIFLTAMMQAEAPVPWLLTWKGG